MDLPVISREDNTASTTVIGDPWCELVASVGLCSVRQPVPKNLEMFQHQLIDHKNWSSAVRTIRGLTHVGRFAVTQRSLKSRSYTP